jgi:hypothetical protein
MIVCCSVAVVLTKGLYSSQISCDALWRAFHLERKVNHLYLQHLTLRLGQSAVRTPSWSGLGPAWPMGAMVGSLVTYK